MIRRRYGRTEIAMPVLTCGGMRFQESWKDIPFEEVPAESQRRMEAVIEKALACGINHIETARGYGSSEAQLGRILPSLPREGLIVQTKAAPTADPKDFLEGFETSLSRLRLDYVDLLSLHGINNRETARWALRKGGCLEAARSLQRNGRARFIGFSTHAAPELIREINATGEFDYVNLHWYFVNQLAWPAIEEAARQDMGVFIISPNDKGGKLYEPPPLLEELCAPLHPMEFNDLFCLSRPQVHTLSIGAARPEDFDIHLRAVEKLPGAASLLPPIERRLRDRVAEVMGPDWESSWHIGLPEHDEAPGGVNLREILRLLGWAKSLDLVAFGKMRYNLLGNAGHWFPGQKAAKFDDAEIRAATASNPFSNRIPDLLREAHALLDDGERKRLSQE